MRFTLTACALLFHATLALAQPAPEATPGKLGVKQIGLAAGLLGQRVGVNRLNSHAAPLLVLVPDEGSYVAALKLWGSQGARFPILIDDGSLPARQDIARFARAFKPESVVRFQADPLPPAAADRQHLIESALYASWNCDSPESYAKTLAERPAALNTVKGPLGIVVTQADDRAWPAALALAAAHGQMLIFPSVTLPNALQTMTLSDVDRLNDAITAAAVSAHLTWASLGDQVDSVTLCLNTPLKVVVGRSDAPRGQLDILNAKSGEFLALTDLVGRPNTSDRQGRWAWCGQIVGSQRESVYRAMCAIFLQPREAFIFDGYDNGPSWQLYDGTKAGKVLREHGVPTTVIDTPNNSAEDWRLVTAGAFATAQRRNANGPARLPNPPVWGGVKAGLICVNSMGNHDFFTLGPNTNCRPGDIPILQVPALLHMVHSWSLQHGVSPLTVGGNWLDHGVFASVGSVHEPYLSAFVPTPDFCARLLDHAPLGAAARIADGPFTTPWRITVLGDPLYTLGPAAPAPEKLPALPRAHTLASELPELLKARPYQKALDTLQMLNRNDDAAHLAASAFADDRAHLTPAAARSGLIAAFTAGDFDTLTKMATLVVPDLKPEDLLITDALWQALWPNLDALTAEQARLLSRVLRQTEYAADALSAAVALKRTDSPAAARTFYDDAKAKAPRPDIKKEMNEREGLLDH